MISTVFPRRSTACAIPRPARPSWRRGWRRSCRRRVSRRRSIPAAASITAPGIPLTLIYPDADIPVTQLSIQAHLDPAHHRRLGQALRNLRQEGRTLILASGGAVHNLRQFAVDSENAAPWALAFDEWLNDRILAGDEEALVGYRATRPEAKLAHPRDEHFLPLFVAMGAGDGRPGRALHRSFAHGSLSMASYAWG